MHLLLWDFNFSTQICLVIIFISSIFLLCVLFSTVKVSSFLQSKILHYMRQMAVITPYAQFAFRFSSDSPEYSLLFYLTYIPLSFVCHSMCDLYNLLFFCRKNVAINFARRTDIMPPIPLETKYHPSAVDLLLIKRLIAESTKQNLLQFLQHEFVNINKSHAERLIGKHWLLSFFK